MRAIIQRVTKADVEVEGNKVSCIEAGLLVLIGFEQNENIEDLQWMSNKIISLRIFQDKKEKMNLSLKDINGDILLVSQFSLHSLLKKGNRPSFVNVCDYEKANNLYNDFVKIVKQDFDGKVSTGIFGANMKIKLVNFQ